MMDNLSKVRTFFRDLDDDLMGSMATTFAIIAVLLERMSASPELAGEELAEERLVTLVRLTARTVRASRGAQERTH